MIIIFWALILVNAVQLYKMLRICIHELELFTKFWSTSIQHHTKAITQHPVKVLALQDSRHFNNEGSTHNHR